jgi:hypothetical protein
MYGASFTRRAVDVARIFSVPPFMCCSTAGKPGKYIST